MKPIVRKVRKSSFTDQLDLVLYVEDEQENRDVAELRLGAKYELLLAKNAEEACKIFRERGEELSAVLMDIQLKGSSLDGIQLTKLIRGTLSEDALPEYAREMPILKVPVIFVTAYGQKYTEEELKGAGGDQLIPKPVDFTALSMAIARVHLAAIRARLGD